MLELDLDNVITALAIATQQEQEALKDAETRQQAVIALSNISETIGQSFPLDKVCDGISEFCKFTASQVSAVLQVLCKSTEDYTTDHRGDVGSWVRLAAMDSIENYVKLWGTSTSVFTEGLLLCLLCINSHDLYTFQM